MDYLTCRNKEIGNMKINNGQYDEDSRETGYCHRAATMCRGSDLKYDGQTEDCTQSSR